MATGVCDLDSLMSLSMVIQSGLISAMKELLSLESVYWVMRSSFFVVNSRFSSVSGLPVEASTTNGRRERNRIRLELNENFKGIIGRLI